MLRRCIWVTVRSSDRDASLAGLLRTTTPQDAARAVPRRLTSSQTSQPGGEPCVSLVLSDIQTSPWKHACNCTVLIAYSVAGYEGLESRNRVDAVAMCGSFCWDKDGAHKEWASASADAGGSTSARAVTPSESAKEDKVSIAVHSHTAPRCCCFPPLVQRRHKLRSHCLACLSVGPPKLCLTQNLFRLIAPQVPWFTTTT